MCPGGVCCHSGSGLTTAMSTVPQAWTNAGLSHKRIGKGPTAPQTAGLPTMTALIGFTTSAPETHVLSSCQDCDGSEVLPHLQTQGSLPQVFGCWQKTGDSWVRDKGPRYSWHSK